MRRFADQLKLTSSLRPIASWESGLPTTDPLSPEAIPGTERNARSAQRVVKGVVIFVFDFEVGGGERWGKNFSSSEEWFALYVRYDRFPWNHVLFTTVGLNTGLNYVEKVSPVELDSCIGKGNPNCARLLHNLSPEITFASPKNPNSEFVIRWHHRSGIWGLMDNVWGGSNTLTGGFRQRF